MVILGLLAAAPVGAFAPLAWSFTVAFQQYFSFWWAVMEGVGKERQNADSSGVLCWQYLELLVEELLDSITCSRHISDVGASEE